MEADERRRRRGSAQSSKKGLKLSLFSGRQLVSMCGLFLRREEMKERLRERLEVERRALKVVERLLEDSVAEDFLVDCAKFITTANYKDAVEERFIAKFCGYPVCPNKLGKVSLLLVSMEAILFHHYWKQRKHLVNVWKIGMKKMEVMLSVRRLREEDIEDPQAASKDPALPLIDSHAQNLIQKRITVERLSSCLRNIVGPVGLTMSDVSTDLNHLVRTFRFTNSNIIHKTPEWTLIAVVLLHLLSDVSPVVQEALKMSASVQYLNTLMEELGLQEQDLLSLVQKHHPRLPIQWL
uniref:RNA polymerase II subunit B1 CTD phosphatase RPAP2 homolog n=1 Tax=Cyprinodon variegatus TaxID=28743 RepID=A0A3Q2FI20_CYPVA